MPGESVRSPMPSLTRDGEMPFMKECEHEIWGPCSSQFAATYAAALRFQETEAWALWEAPIHGAAVVVGGPPLRASLTIVSRRLVIVGSGTVFCSSRCVHGYM
jgi:hypothetical protein